MIKYNGFKTLICIGNGAERISRYEIKRRCFGNGADFPKRNKASLFREWSGADFPKRNKRRATFFRCLATLTSRPLREEIRSRNEDRYAKQLKKVTSFREIRSA